MAGRPPGSPNKLAKSWVYDQLVERNFNVLDEAIKIFRDAGDDRVVKVEILRMLVEYALPKPRPVDAEGMTENPMLFSGAASLSDEKLVWLMQIANAQPIIEEKKEGTK